MKVKLTLTVDKVVLAKARVKLKLTKRSISSEVEALLLRIADEKEPVRKSWSEQFGDLRIRLDMKEAESDSQVGKHLRRTGAYKAAKAAQRKAKK